MSAIFGFYGSPNQKRLIQMQNALTHRGCTVEIIQCDEASIGYWKSPWASERCGAGITETDSGIIALAGFQTPGPAGQIFSLTEIASHLAENESLPEELTGDYVITFWANNNRFFLARDGSGSRTVYYSKWNKSLLFASEPKGIWSIDHYPRRLAPDSLAKYLAFSFVPGDATMLQGLHELCPGHFLRADQSSDYSIQRYFRFEDVQQDESNRISTEQSIPEFRRAFSQATADRLAIIDNQPPVVFLSGGLDSSVVAAEIANQSDQELNTFSLHFGADYPNELEYARKVARRIRSNHHEVLIQPRDFIKDLPSMIWHLDDPIGDPITMPNYSLAKQVSGQTDFVFNGEGGDPCFGGPKNIPMMLLHWYGIPQLPLFREKAYLASYRRAYEELDHIFTPEFKQSLKLDSLPQVLTPFFECERPRNFLDKLTSINIRLKGGHLILPKVERMLGANGLSPLSPLFSSEMVQFSFRIPSTMKLHKGVEKIVIKQAFRDLIPDEVVARPKSGMRVPVHFWFQGELKKYARKILSPRSIRQAGIFNHRRVKQLLDYNIEEGNGRYGMRLWMLLTFEFWRRMVIEKRNL